MAHRNNAQRIIETMVTNLFMQRNPPKPLSALDSNNFISSWNKVFMICVLTELKSSDDDLIEM